MLRQLSLSASLVLLIPQGSVAQSLPRSEEVVTLRAEPARLSVRAGAATALKLKLEILPGFHINSNQPLEGYLIPTEVFLPAVGKVREEFELAGARYPKPQVKTFSFAPGEKLAVYEGTVEVAVRLRARPDVAAGKRTVALGLRYQACNNEICLRPAERQLTLNIEVHPKLTPR